MGGDGKADVQIKTYRFQEYQMIVGFVACDALRSSHRIYGTGEKKHGGCEVSPCCPLKRHQRR